MKIWTSEHTFNHQWDSVVEASWRKYPNPINPAVTGIDVLDRRVGEDGILRSSRLMRTVWPVPMWATRLIGLENPSFAYEYSEVDARARRMTLRARNVSCASFVCVDETLVYRPHPDAPTERTLLEQSAVISVFGIPLKDRMESLMESTINTNASKGRAAMEWVIDRLRLEDDELTQKMHSTRSELAATATRGINELLRRGIEEGSAAVTAERRNSFGKSSG